MSEQQQQKQMTPDQLQWVLDHNMQIRAGHRVQIADAVTAWRKTEADLSRLEAENARLRELEGDAVTLRGYIASVREIAEKSKAEAHAATETAKEAESKRMYVTAADQLARAVVHQEIADALQQAIGDTQ